MTQLYLPQEDDFKKWISESISEAIKNSYNQSKKEEEQEPLISRQQMADELGVSLVTLTDWMKHGLPYRKLHNRVYFFRSEVLKSMSKHHLK